MSKFPRIASEDFKNAFEIIKNVIKDSESLQESNYNSNFKEEIITAVNDLKITLQIGLVGSNSASSSNSAVLSGALTTEQILTMAVTGYNEVLADKNATAASKTNAIKFLKDAAKELEDVKELQKMVGEVEGLKSFIKQFLVQLIDEKIIRDPRTIANEFLNRLKELSENS